MSQGNFFGIGGGKLSRLISKEQIRERVKELGSRIRKDYGDENICMLCVLNGAFIFAADLIREIESPCEISFIRLSSYSGTESTGTVKKVSELPGNLKGKNVLIVEDIVDTGYTMKYLVEEIKKMDAKSVKVATLFDKPSRRKCDVQVDYIGIEIEDKFIVGYGLDYDEKFRNLPDVYTNEN